MRVGLFFGSFNPIHNGHIRIARSVLERAICDEVWLVVSPQNPFKAGVDMLSERERFSLVEQALLAEPQIKACDVELDMPKPSYTIDTLNELERMYPNVEFAIIMGGDNMAKFDKWKAYKELAARFQLIAYPRPGSEIPDFMPKNTILIEAPLMEISSTEIRARVIEGRSISDMVPLSVEEQIKNLYK